MANTHEYNIIARLFRWIRRFRQRCGYGVHSPLAFQFITDVIYNSGVYYAYDTLRQPLSISASRLDEYDPLSGLIAKDLRLLFRLANFQEAHTIAIQGSIPTIVAYLFAARPHADVVGKENMADADFIYTDFILCPPSLSKERTTSLPPLKEGGMHVLRGIHSSKDAEALWEQCCAHPSATLSFDLWRFGILLNRPKIIPQAYIVNYF